jgi:hypothetical protein
MRSKSDTERDDRRREHEHEGETFACRKCGTPGVVGDDLLSGHTISEPGSYVSWWWGHRSCYPEAFEC